MPPQKRSTFRNLQTAPPADLLKDDVCGRATRIAMTKMNHSVPPASNERLKSIIVRCLTGILATIVFMAIALILMLWWASQPVVSETLLPQLRQQSLQVPWCQTLPPTATDVYFARASVGIGGRFYAYRFSAPLMDLQTHAMKEFAAHSEPLTPTVVPGQPFDIDVAFLRDSYGVKLSWIDPAQIGPCTVFRDADSPGSPSIYVDETNSVLYFINSD